MTGCKCLWIFSCKELNWVLFFVFFFSKIKRNKMPKVKKYDLNVIKAMARYLLKDKSSREDTDSDRNMVFQTQYEMLCYVVQR